jgi:hypothetical protein
MQAWLKDRFGEIARSVLLALGSALLGAAGMILAPVGDELRDLIRPESVSLDLNSPDQVTQGHVLDLSCTIQPLPSNGVSGGVLKLSWEPKTSLQEMSPIKSLPVEQLKQPIQLPMPSWQLRAERLGVVHLTATFSNRKGQSITVMKTISIVHPDSSLPPSQANYTGIWQISISFTGERRPLAS